MNAPQDDASPSQEISASEPAVASAALTGCLPRLVDEPALDRWVYGLLAVALVIGYFVATHAFWSPAHPGTDQNGYLVGGKLLAATGSNGFKPGDPYEFVGRMWVESADGTFFPKYPVGLSAIYALTLKFGGAAHALTASFLVSPLAMTLAIFATFLLLRLIVGSLAALLGTLLIASSPVALGLTNNPNSHATAVCLVTWGMYLLVRWWQSAGLARAIGAGLLIGSAVTIRYTEGLLVLPLIAVAMMNLRWRDRRSWIQTLSLGAAWALPVVILVSYNWFSFHHLTGYDPTNESTGFSWESFQNNWETMTRHLYNTGLFFILPFSVLGLVWMWRWNWRVALLLSAWCVPSLAVYTAYYWAPDGNWIAYLRFFLTIMPSLALAAVWSLKKLTEQAAAAEGSTVMPKVGVGVLLAIGCGVNLYTALGEMEVEAKTNVTLADSGQCVLKACPAGSVIFGQNATLNYLQLIGDYRLYDVQQFNRAVVQQLASIDPDQPNGLQPQRAHEMYERLKDMTEPQLIKEQNTLMTDALAKNQRVFFVFPKPATAQFMRFAPKRSFQTDVMVSWEEMANTRPMRRQQFAFGRQPWTAPDPTRSIIWQIFEVKLAPAEPPPKPKPQPMPKPKSMSKANGATTHPATMRPAP